MSGTPEAPDSAASSAGGSLTPPDGERGSAAAAAFNIARTPRELLNAMLTAESNAVFVGLVAIVLVVSLTHPAFTSLFQIQTVMAYGVYIGVIGCGMAFLIALRELDLSVSNLLALTAGIAALLWNQGWNPWLAVVAALLCAMVAGVINGFLVVTIGINALLATLAMNFVLGGLNDGLAGSNTITPGLNPTNEEALKGIKNVGQTEFGHFFGGKFLSLPVAFWIMIVLAIVLTLVLRYTPFGYRVRSIGSNPEAAAFSGISLTKVRYQAFILTSFCAGLAGIITLGVLQSADPSVGGQDNLLAIAAVIVGGTPIIGGRATVFGAVMGALLISCVYSALPYFNISLNWTNFALGLVILVAVSVDSVLRLAFRRRTTT